MWEKSVANDDNECNDDNEECDPVNPAPVAATEKSSPENGQNQSRASGERLSAANIYETNQEVYPRALKYSHTPGQELAAEEECKGTEGCSLFYCSQNGYYKENAEEMAGEGDLHPIEDAHGSQCNYHVSQIKPSNTYPIIKDLNKLRSMSLPSMVVAATGDDKNEAFPMKAVESYDKKYDDDGGDNPGGGYTNNENNHYSYSNVYHDCNQPSSHRYVRNNYLNERGLNGSNSNTNDVCTEPENAIHESVSSKVSNQVQSDTCSQSNAYLEHKVISHTKSDTHNCAQEDGEEENEEKHQEKVEEEVEEEEEEEEDESESGTSLRQVANALPIEINGNQVKCSISRGDSSQSNFSVSYAANGNIRSRANIVVKPQATNNSDRASLSSSGSYYYTTTTISASPSFKNHIRPILKTSSTSREPCAPLAPHEDASPPSISNRRTSASYSSRSSLSSKTSNSHLLLNHIPVLSFPGEEGVFASQEPKEKESPKCSYSQSPMSQSSSDSGSVSTSASGTSSQSHRPGQRLSQQGSSGSAMGRPSPRAPATPPTTPPPLLEIVSSRRRRFFVK